MKSLKKLGYEWGFDKDTLSLFKRFNGLEANKLSNNKLHILKADPETIELIYKMLHDLPDTH